MPPNSLTSTLTYGQWLLQAQLGRIVEAVGDAGRIDVLDIGPGNGAPARPVLQYLRDRDLLGRYIAVDISPRMLDIAVCYLRRWFGAGLPIEGYVLDVTRQALQGLETDGRAGFSIPAVVLLLGGTLGNLPRPDRTLTRLRGQLRACDLLVVSDRIEHPPEGAFLDRCRLVPVTDLSPFNRHLLDVLSLDPSSYQVESGYDARQEESYLRVRMKVPVRLHLPTAAGSREFDLDPDAPFLMWRHWGLTRDQFSDRHVACGFEPVVVTPARNEEFVVGVFRKGQGERPSAP